MANKTKHMKGGTQQTKFLKRLTGYLAVFALTALILVPLIQVGHAIEPDNIISYQGRILDSNGVPVAAAAADMQFRFYDALVAGTCLWSNDDTACATNADLAVTLTDGLFSENLGDTGNGYAAIDDDVFADNDEVYLEVEVEGETLTPRKRVVATPYALNAQTLDGIDSGSFMLNTGDVATGEFDFSGAEFISATPMVFEGPSNDGVTTSFQFIDPTGANIVTFQDGSGTVAFLTDITAGLWEDGANGVFEDDEAVIVGIDAAFTYATGGVGDLRVADELEVLGDAWIDNDFVVGASTSSTETMANAGFVLGGDDLFVAGTAGIEGNIYTDGRLIVGASTQYGDGIIETTVATSGLQFDISAAAGDFDFVLGENAGDDFIIDTNTLVIESDDNQVGIGTATPSDTLSIVSTETTAYGLSITANSLTTGEAVRLVRNGVADNGGFIGMNDGTDEVLIFSYAGSPDTALTAPRGSVALDYTNGRVYVNTNDGTAWTQLAAAGAGNTLDLAYDEGGAGAGRSITVDSGAVQLTGSNAADYTLSVSTNAAGGALYVNDTDGTGYALLVDAGDVRIDDALTIGDASGDTVTSNAADWTFANDTAVTLSGGVNGLNFDSNTLSIDATNDRVGMGTAAPNSRLHVIESGSVNAINANLDSSLTSGYPKAGSFSITSDETLTGSYGANAVYGNLQFSGDTDDNELVAVGGHFETFISNGATMGTANEFLYGIWGEADMSAGVGETINVARGATASVSATAGTISAADGVRGEVDPGNANGTITTARGVYGRSNVSAGTTTSGYGGYFIATGATNNYGVYVENGTANQPMLRLYNSGDTERADIFVGDSDPPAVAADDGSLYLLDTGAEGELWLRTGGAWSEVALTSEIGSSLWTDGANGYFSNTEAIIVGADAAFTYGSGAAGDLRVTDEMEVLGDVYLGNAAGDAVTSNAADWTFANDTAVTLSGGVNGLNFDSNTLSIDATNDRVGMGTAAPTAKLEVEQAAAATGVLIDQNGNAIALSVDSVATTANTLDVVSNSTTTGNVVNISATSLTSGDALNITRSAVANNGGFISMNDGTDDAIIFTYGGSPNGALTAPRGSMALDYTNGRIYVNTDDANAWTQLAAAGSGNTLDLAYDEGGAGSGRVINVTDGAVEMIGTNAADYTLEVTTNAAGGALYVTDTDGTGYALLVDAGDVRIDDALTIGDAAGDTVTANAADWTFANDTAVTLSGGVNGLNFDSNTLSIDATNDRVGIGTAAPLATLDVRGAATFNEASAAVDFRIESDGNANMFFVDGSDDEIGIGTNNPVSMFHVSSGGSSAVTVSANSVGDTGPGTGLAVSANDLSDSAAFAIYAAHLDGSPNMTGNLMRLNQADVDEGNTGSVLSLINYGSGANLSSTLISASTGTTTNRYNGYYLTTNDNELTGTLDLSGVYSEMSFTGDNNTNGTTLRLRGGWFTTDVEDGSDLDGTVTNQEAHGVSGYVTMKDDDTLGNAYGVSGRASSSNGTISDAYGLYGDVYTYNAAATMTDAYGVYGRVYENGGGTITTGYGGYFTALDAGTTIGTFIQNENSDEPVIRLENLNGGSTEQMDIIVGDTDPSSSAVSADRASLYLEDTGSAGNIYIKQDNGSSINWSEVITSSYSGLSPTLDDAYDNFGAAAQLVTVDDAATGLEFSIDAAGHYVIDLQSTGDFIIQDAGTDFATFNDSGNVDFANNVTLGSSDTDDIDVNGEFISDLIPNADDTYTLGDADQRWSDIFLGPESIHIGTATGDEYIIGYDTGNNALVYNEAGGNFDVRIEGDGEANLFMIDAGSDAVLVGTNTAAGSELFNITLDAGENAFIDAATTDSTLSGSGTLQINVDSSTDLNFGLGIDYEVTDDGVANVNGQAGIFVAPTMSSNDGDTLVGVMVQDLGGTASTGLEVGMLAGTGYDFGLISNSSIYTTGTSDLAAIGDATRWSSLVSVAGLSTDPGDDEIVSGARILNQSDMNPATGNTVNVYGIDALGHYNGADTDATLNVAGIYAYGAASSGTGTNNVFGVDALAQELGGSVTNAYGVRAQANTAAGTNYGGFFTASAATTNYGVYANVSGAATTNYGVYSTVSGGTTNYSGIFNGGNVGIGDTTPDALLNVEQTASATAVMIEQSTTNEALDIDQGYAYTGSAGPASVYAQSITVNNTGDIGAGTPVLWQIGSNTVNVYSGDAGNAAAFYMQGYLTTTSFRGDGTAGNLELIIGNHAVAEVNSNSGSDDSVGSLYGQVGQAKATDGSAVNGYGVYGMVGNDSASTGSITTGYGVWGGFNPSGVNETIATMYGGYFDVSDAAAATNYAGAFMGGNVGIGTNTPDADLEISAAQDTELIRLYDSSNSDFAGLFVGTGDPNSQTSGAGAGSLFLDETGTVWIATAEGDASWSELATSSASTTLDDAYDNFGAAAQLVTVDDATTGLEFSVDAAGDFVIDLQSTGDFLVQDGGTAFATFNDSGNVAFANDVDLGSSSADNITINGYVDSNIIPDADDTYDLGSDALRWQEVWVGPTTIHIGNTVTTDEYTISYNDANNQLVLNEDGLDFDMRIEGDSIPDLFYVDAGNNRISIGTNAAGARLDVLSDLAEIAFRVNTQATSTATAVLIGNPGSGDAILLNNTGSGVGINLDMTDAGNNADAINVTHDSTGSGDGIVVSLSSNANTGSALGLTHAGPGDALSIIKNIGGSGIDLDMNGNSPFLIEGLNVNVTNAGLGGSAAANFYGSNVQVWTGGGSVDFATGAGDLYVEDDLEVDGTVLGDLDPGFTVGSVVFAAAGGLSEDNANFFWNNATKEFYLGGTTVATADIHFGATGSAVFNEIGSSVDFRVEGDTNVNMLFVDGSADRVGIGTNSPSAMIDIDYNETTTAAGSYYGMRSDTDSTGIFTAGTANVYGIYGDATSSGVSTGGTVNTYGGYFTATGNNGGAATTNSYALYVDAGTGADNNYAGIFANGNVGIGVTDPDADLDISSNAAGESLLYLDAGANVDQNVFHIENAGTGIGFRVSNSNAATGGRGFYLTQAADQEGLLIQSDATTQSSIHVAANQNSGSIIYVTNDSSGAGSAKGLDIDFIDTEITTGVPVYITPSANSTVGQIHLGTGQNSAVAADESEIWYDDNNNQFCFDNGTEFCISNLNVGLWVNGTNGYYSNTEAIIVGADAAFTYGSGGAGDLKVTDELEVLGSTWLGNAATDNVVFNADVNSNILPNTDDTYTLGDADQRWADIFLGSESLHIGTATADEYIIGYDTGNNALVYNEAGDDFDVRIEGATDTDLFRIDAGNDRVGVGTATPNATLSIDGSLSRDPDNNNLYGTNAATHVNLGNSSTTGASGFNYQYATVGGGNNNVSAATYSVINGGASNTIAGPATGGMIAGGFSNDITAGTYGAIGAGRDNTNAADNSWVGGRYVSLGAAADNSFAWGFDSAADIGLIESNSFYIFPIEGSDGDAGQVLINTDTSAGDFTLVGVQDTIASISGSFTSGLTAKTALDINLTNDVDYGATTLTTSAADLYVDFGGDQTTGDVTVQGLNSEVEQTNAASNSYDVISVSGTARLTTGDVERYLVGVRGAAEKDGGTLTGGLNGMIGTVGTAIVNSGGGTTDYLYGSWNQANYLSTTDNASTEMYGSFNQAYLQTAVTVGEMYGAFNRSYVINPAATVTSNYGSYNKAITNGAATYGYGVYGEAERNGGSGGYGIGGYFLSSGYDGNYAIYTESGGVHIDTAAVPGTSASYAGGSGELYVKGDIETDANLYLDNGGDIINTSGDLQIRNGFICVDNDGASCAGTAGQIEAAAFNINSNPDIAEHFDSVDVLSAGEVVAIDPNNHEQVVRATSAYQETAVGIVATEPGVLLGKELPGYPVALKGRVPVRVSDENGQVEIGDYLTSSSTPGYAMKATEAGPTVGRALQDAGVGNDVVVAYVNTEYYTGAVIDSDGVDTLVNDTLVMNSLSEATVGTPAVDSETLVLRGSAWSGSAAVDQDMKVNTLVSADDDYRLSISNNNDAEVAYFTNTGDLMVAGRIYPSDRGTLQTDKYIYYDGSVGPGGDMMRTNASGWSTGSYDFAEMFPSDQDLEPGDVVVFDTANEHVVRSAEAYDGLVAGIVSTKPGFLAGENTEGDFPVALAGRVPTKVSLENGPIAVGDPLTTSSTPGYAMKATEAGPIVGNALEPYTGSGDDKIIAFVNVSYWGGGITDSTPGTSSPASSFGGSSTNLSSLTLGGNLYMQANDILNINRLTGVGDWQISPEGDFKTKGSYMAIIESYQGEEIEVQAELSLEATVTLSGTAQLSNGQVTIDFEDIDPRFNDIISTIAPVRVMAMPIGEPVTLYVNEQDNNGFTIMSDGLSDAEFNWFVTAYRKDMEPEIYLNPEEVVEEEVIEEEPAEEEVVEEPTEEGQDAGDPEDAEDVGAQHVEPDQEEEPIVEEEPADNGETVEDPDQSGGIDEPSQVAPATGEETEGDIPNSDPPPETVE